MFFIFQFCVLRRAYALKCSQHCKKKVKITFLMFFKHFLKMCLLETVLKQKICKNGVPNRPLHKQFSIFWTTTMSLSGMKTVFSVNFWWDHFRSQKNLTFVSPYLNFSMFCTIGTKFVAVTVAIGSKSKLAELMMSNAMPNMMQMNAVLGTLAPNRLWDCSKSFKTPQNTSKLNMLSKISKLQPK